MDGCGSVVELSPLNLKVGGLIPACQSVTEPSIAPTVIRWCVNVHEWFGKTDTVSLETPSTNSERMRCEWVNETSSALSGRQD